MTLEFAQNAPTILRKSSIFRISSWKVSSSRNGLRSQILSVPSVQGRFNSVMSESRYAYMHLICIRESENADVASSRTEDHPDMNIFLLGQLAHFRTDPSFGQLTSQIRSEGGSAPQAGALPDDGLFGFFLYSGVAISANRLPGHFFFSRKLSGIGHFDEQMIL